MGTEGPGPFPLEDRNRLGTITGSVVKDVLQGRDVEALLSIFQLRGEPDAKTKELFERGHKEEEPTAVFYIKARSQREGKPIRLSHPRFRRHALYPYIGATGDRQLIGKNEGAQMKFRAGARCNDPVRLHQKDCKRQADCVCIYSSVHFDQCCLEMYVYGWDRNDLVVRSAVGGDWMHITRNVLKKWLLSAMPVLYRFYKTYLEWYWTHIRDPRLLEPVRTALSGIVPDLDGVLFTRRPASIDAIRISKELKFSAPPTECVNDVLLRLPAAAVRRIQQCLGHSHALHLILPSNSSFWLEKLKTLAAIKTATDAPASVVLVEAAKAMRGSRPMSARDLYRFVSRVSQEISARRLCLAFCGRGLPFCFHGKNLTHPRCPCESWSSKPRFQ